MKFKFKSFAASKSRRGRTQKGELTEQGLQMGDEFVPAEQIVLATYQAIAHDSIPARTMMIHVLSEESGKPLAMPLQISGNPGPARRLAERICVVSSAARAAARRAGMAEQGREGAFRSAICPSCGVTIDLTEAARSQEVWCPYCDMAFDPADGADNKQLHVCPRCGLYSELREYTWLFVLILVVAYYVSSQRRLECLRCMRRSAWQMVGANFLFVFGLPFALVQLFRAYLSGGSTVRELDGANHLAGKGHDEEAGRRYEDLAGILIPSAPVRYNHAISICRADRLEQAIVKLKEALAVCSNFKPAHVLLCRCYETTGRTQELAAQTEQWIDPLLGYNMPIAEQA